MGLKDNQLFPIERIKVAKIQGRTNTRQDLWTGLCRCLAMMD